MWLCLSHVFSHFSHVETIPLTLCLPAQIQVVEMHMSWIAEIHTAYCCIYIHLSLSLYIYMCIWIYIYVMYRFFSEDARIQHCPIWFPVYSKLRHI